MNEHDYYVFEQISILVGSLFVIIGWALLTLFKMLTYENTILLVFVFLVFFFLALYFYNKRYNLQKEMMEELKKYLNNGDDNGSES